MDDEVIPSTNKSSIHGISAYSHMKMRQREAPLSNCTVDHVASCIPTNRNSRLITKQKRHKIRIMHIMPPEIIQTDKDNFKILVQSLTGKSSSPTNTGIKKHQRPQVSSSNQNMSYFSGLSHTKFNPSNLLSDDPNHEKLNLDVDSDHDLLIGGFEAKVEKNEMTVQDVVDAEWGTLDKLENGFCIDGFQEFDEWFPQGTKFPDSELHDCLQFGD